MIRPLIRTCIILCCVVWSAGCLTLPGAKAPKPKVVGFPKGNISDGTKREPKLIGKIALVNEEGKFVLIACGPWAVPEEGTALKCLRNGVESAIVNAGKERRGIHVAADIVTGSPQRGDQVFQ